MENNETMNNVTEIVDDSVKDTDVTDLTVTDLDSEEKESSISPAVVVVATAATIGVVCVGKAAYKGGKKAFNWVKGKVKDLKKNKKSDTVEAAVPADAIDGEFEDVNEIDG